MPVAIQYKRELAARQNSSREKLRRCREEDSKSKKSIKDMGFRSEKDAWLGKGGERKRDVISYKNALQVPGGLENPRIADYRWLATGWIWIVGWGGESRFLKENTRVSQ